MKHKFQHLLCILIFTLPFFCRGQSTFNCTSNSVNVKGNVYDYSIGEMVLISTKKSPRLIITQGFLQPSSNAKKNYIAQQAESNSIKIYPNPTKSIIHLDILEDKENEYSYTLVDIYGKTIFFEKIDGSKRYNIDMKALAAGVYYLNIVNLSKKTTTEQTFKIQKI